MEKEKKTEKPKRKRRNDNKKKKKIINKDISIMTESMPPISAVKTLSLPKSTKKRKLLLASNDELDFFKERRVSRKKRLQKIEEIVPIEGGESCIKCLKNTVTYVMLQMRSADEGASTLYKCKSCLHSWKRNT